MDQTCKNKIIEMNGKINNYVKKSDINTIEDYLICIHKLKSLMNMQDCVFVLTTNNFNDVEVGVRNRCHCIPFNAAPDENWLPLCRRILSDVGINNISDQSLLKVIATGNGSARDILDAVVSIVLKVERSNNSVAPVQDGGQYV